VHVGGPYRLSPVPLSSAVGGLMPGVERGLEKWGGLNRI
jgi:hypothetical protein